VTSPAALMTTISKPTVALLCLLAAAGTFASTMAICTSALPADSPTPTVVLPNEQWSANPTTVRPIQSPALAVAKNDDRTPLPDIGLSISRSLQRKQDRAPDDARSNVQVVKEEFGHWAGIAEQYGLKVPPEFRLPAELHDVFAKATREFEQSLKAVEAVRLPLVQAIVDRKLAGGQFEEFRNPEAESGDAAREARSTLRKSRKPTQPNQSVSVSGDARHVRLIRVDQTDDPSLPPLYDAIAAARLEYYQSVHVFLSPFLSR